MFTVTHVHLFVVAKKFLVEPIILPEMHHLSVDEPIKASDQCLFYPSGEKSLNMRREFEKTIQHLHVAEQIVTKASPSNSGMITKKRSSTAQLKNSKSQQKLEHFKDALYYTKKPDDDVRSLLKEVRETEYKLAGTLNLRL